MLSSESGQLGTILGFGPTIDSSVTRQVDLPWETEQMYVIRDRASVDARIIQVDRDQVDAVLAGGSVATPVAPSSTAP